MKFCSRPFEQMYVKETYVKTCPWMELTLGNPLETSLDELWNNDKAKLARESIKDGSFRYCRKEECPYCASGKLEEIDEEYVTNYEATEYPINMNVSYDQFCNHSCPSCRSSVFIPDEKYKQHMDILKEVVLPFANNTEYLTTCGMGDCFSSPFIMGFLKELRPQKPNFSISFETNGVMFDEKHWEMISHLHKFPINLTITPNSFERNTYKYLSGGHDSLDRCKKNLKFISKLKKEGKITSFKINMVVQESNYCEIPSFIKTCLEEYDPDLIQIKPINRWFCLNLEGYWYKNVLNPMHPHHKNYLEVMKDPILKHPKVWDWTEENHDRDPKEHPAVYGDRFGRLVYKLLMMNDYKSHLSKKIEELNIKNIAIYGSWEFGDMCYNILKDSTEIKCFIDKRKGNRINQCSGLPIRGLWKQDFSDLDTILISVTSSINEITEDLRTAGYTGKIITLKDLL